MTDLPQGLTSRIPGLEDHEAIIALVAAHQQTARGSSSVDPAAVASAVTGTASWTRRQVVVQDAAGEVVAWASVHDRAAGRSVVESPWSPGPPDEPTSPPGRCSPGPRRPRSESRNSATWPAPSWTPARMPRTRGSGVAHGGGRTAYPHLAADEPPGPASEAEPAALPSPREGVTVRRVAKHENGLPVAQDLQPVHQMLEESFADHFNSYRESFPEFVQRLREDPGHRWDHWWIAFIDVDGEQLAGGALVSSVLPRMPTASRAATSTTSACTGRPGAAASPRPCSTP